MTNARDADAFIRDLRADVGEGDAHAMWVVSMAGLGKSLHQQASREHPLLARGMRSDSGVVITGVGLILLRWMVKHPEQAMWWHEQLKGAYSEAEDEMVRRLSQLLATTEETQ